MATAGETMQARKQDFVRSVIWDAAIDLFAEKGFDETTIDEIAASAGVSRRSFFRYFSSKDDLMGQGIASYGTALSEAIASAPRNWPDLEVIRHTAMLVATEAARQPRTRKVVQVARENSSARQSQLSRMADVEQRVAEAFGERCARGDVTTPRLLAHLLLAILDVTFRCWSDSDGQDISQIGDAVLARLSTIICQTSRKRIRNKR